MTLWARLAGAGRWLACAGAVLASGCTTVNVDKTCTFSPTADLVQTGPNNLAVLIGAPADRFTPTPDLYLSTPTQANPIAEVRFDLERADVGWPDDLRATACTSVDWRRYDLTVDATDWQRFTDELGLQAFELSVGFASKPEPLRLNTFGIAVIDRRVDVTLWSCGCLQLSEVMGAPPYGDGP